MESFIRICEIINLPVQSQVSLCGKISKIRKMGGIIFVIVHDQSGQCQAVFENAENFSYQKNDFIYIEGFVNILNSKTEVYAERSHLVGSSNQRITSEGINYSKKQKLIFKSQVMQVINHYMEHEDFLPVSSPTIVGNWVEGKTNSFEVNYFGTPKYLTLNSMLYHQAMLIAGYNRIYEYSKIFRQDSTSPKDRLAEFISLDISMSHSGRNGMMQFVEDMIKDIICKLHDQDMIKISKDVKFDRISYTDLIKESGCKDISGTQLTSKPRKYLDNYCKGFVWVYGFPEEKRRFFVKSIDGVCQDYQLWYGGRHQIASGGERETDLALIKQKIIKEGKELSNYDTILRHFEGGVPSMCEIGFGLDRFLVDITESAEISDFVAFPRNGNTNF